MTGSGSSFSPRRAKTAVLRASILVMPSRLRSDSDPDELGRGRSATYPPRPSRRSSEYSLDRDDWCPKGLESRRHTSPLGLFHGKRSSSLLKKPEFGTTRSLKKKWTPSSSSRGGDKGSNGGGSSTSWGKGKLTSPVPTSCESASGTSRSGVAQRGPRRRYRKGWEEGGFYSSPSAPPTRQQRLVTAMFGLVVVLASIQIIALVVHPPREERFATGFTASIAGPEDGGGGGGGGSGNGVRRRTVGGGGGLRDTFASRSSGDNSKRRGDNNNISGEWVNGGGGSQQQQGLSLSNPRAFEMVAADMGHLKDTVSYQYEYQVGYNCVLSS